MSLGDDDDKYSPKRDTISGKFNKVLKYRLLNKTRVFLIFIILLSTYFVSRLDVFSALPSAKEESTRPVDSAIKQIIQVKEASEKDSIKAPTVEVVVKVEPPPKKIEEVKVTPPKPDEGQKVGDKKVVSSPKFPESADSRPNHIKEPSYSNTKKLTTTVGYADEQGMKFIKDMMKHAWGSYVTFAWGTDELKPISKTGRNWHASEGIANTIVDALDTLWIMDMKEEFKKARDYVAKDLNFDIPIAVSTFETTIRILGGLNSAYDLSGDEIFKTKAKDIGERLFRAFDTPSGIPSPTVNLQNSGTNGFGMAVLAEYGTLQLEFEYLSTITGDPKYGQKALKVIESIQSKSVPFPGLIPTSIQIQNGDFLGGTTYTLGAMADSYYEYLLKVWLLDPKKHAKFRGYYDLAAKAIKEKLVRKTANGDVFVGASNDGKYVPEIMEHLACFSGGMFALGAATKKSDDWKEYFSIGAGITETCYKMYHNAPLGISGESMDLSSFTPGQLYYILRPEVIESIFIMWRLTHDEKYRKWGMEIAQNIEKHCRVEGGYVGLNDVRSAGSINDNQESFFLAETLKYLYLLFTDDSVIPLEDYVFNTEAHPIRIARSQ